MYTYQKNEQTGTSQKNKQQTVYQQDKNYFTLKRRISVCAHEDTNIF